MMSECIGVSPLRRSKVSFLLILSVLVIISVFFQSTPAQALVDEGYITFHNKVKHLDGGGTVGVAASGKSLLLINPERKAVEGEISFRHRIEAVAVDEEGSMALVLSKKALYVLDMTSGEVGLIDGGIKKAEGVEICSGMGTGLVFTHHKNEIYFVDLGTFSVKGKIKLRGRVSELECYAEGGLLLVVTDGKHKKKGKEEKDVEKKEGKKAHRKRSHGGGVEKSDEDEEEHDKVQLLVIDLQTSEVISEYEFDREVKNISIDESGAKAGVLTEKGKIYMIDLTTLGLKQLATIHGKAGDVEVHGGRVLVTEEKRGTLLVIDVETGRLEEELQVGKKAREIARAGSYYLVSFKEGVRVFREKENLTLTAIEPVSVTAGSIETEMVVKGTGFQTGSGVLMDGTSVTTAFLTETELQAVVPAGYLTSPSVHTVSVKNPDGEESNRIEFRVESPEPYISSVVPIETDAGTGAMVIELYGSGFLPDTKVFYDGNERVVNYIKDTKLTAELDPADTSVAGIYSIVAENTNYDGTPIQSNTFQFTVKNPVPVITGISPLEAEAGSGDTLVTITGSGFINETELRFNESMISVNTVTPVAITATVPGTLLQPIREYSVTVVNPAPGGGESNGVTFKVTNRLRIVIDSPSGGETVRGEGIIVHGAYESLIPEVGVVVNGVVADIVGNEWVANGVRLPEGENTITATVTDSYEKTAEATITVSQSTNTEGIELNANITGGILPFTTYFTATTTGITPVRYEMDYEGDGIFDYTWDSFEDVFFTYTTEGIYYPEIRVTDDQGNTYTDRVAIVVHDRAVIDSILRGIWYGMKQALLNKDVDGAVEYFSPVTQQLYREIYTTIIDRLPDIAQRMQDIELIYVKNNTAKYRIKKTELYGLNMYTLTYYIYFTKDNNGVWKIYRY